jgi:hypothetical protein
MAERDEVAELRGLLDRLDAKLKGPRKASDNPRELFRSKSHAAWLEAVQACIATGMTQNALITRLGVDVRTFIDWREAKRQVPAWAVSALPEVGRIAYCRALLLPSEPPSRTGTDG